MKKIFISYSHKDEKWKDRLVEQLKVLELEGSCSLWDDTLISPGRKWEKEIESALKQADVAILLVSPNFLSSDFIINDEVPFILGLGEMEKLVVIPLILESCDWKKLKWLATREVVPKGDVPLKDLSESQVEEKLGALAETIKGILADDTTPPKPGPPIDMEQFIKMIKSAYFILRVDQFSNKLKTKNRFDDYLWGWSVCDPRRKKKVAKSQAEELRPASIVVSSFIISAYSSALDIPGIGIKSDDITTDMVNSLNLRYYEKPGNKGVFGTPEKIIHTNGADSPIVNPNCRHISAALSILLRIIQNKVKSSISTNISPGDFSRIFPALRFLKDLEEYTLFSQEPELLKGFPDCATCAIVLELLVFLESIKSLFPYNSKNPKNPFASSDELKEWTTGKIHLGLNLLKQLRIRVKDRDHRFWDYSIDKERFKGYRQGDGIPPLINVYENIELYHTCRMMYLLRNLLSKPEYKNDLMHAVDSLVEIMNENDGAIPISYPPKESDIYHITNTAFFLNALIPDDISVLDPRFHKVLNKGINKISEMCDKKAQEHLKAAENIDLYADGMGMILRLLFYLKWIFPNQKFVDVEELKVLNDSARKLQEYIYENKMDSIKQELDKVQLQGCFPIIEDRIVYPRNWWINTYGPIII